MSITTITSRYYCRATSSRSSPYESPPFRLVSRVLCGPRGVLRRARFKDLEWLCDFSHPAPIVDMLRVHEYDVRMKASDCNSHPVNTATRSVEPMFMM